ncbi:MAG: SpoIID/LytB domain-containing protein [bacterium]|nr:SpoIID/LytB domain-containing protein [bacterium]
MPPISRILSSVSTLILIFLMVSCAPVDGVLKNSAGGPIIKVAILKVAGSVTISGEKLLLDMDGMRLEPQRSTLVFEAFDGALTLEGRIYHPKLLSIHGSHIRLNDRPYRGNLSIIIDGDLITVINSLALEDYLFGLINHEISSKWPLEAVKAQAVAARTYAYLKIGSNSDKAYHLESTVIDQVYGGSSMEDERARRAVRETKGEMLYYGNDLARTFYHSSCGGRTEAAQNVWGSDFPYLKTVEDEFCADAPNYFWSYESTFDSIYAAMKEEGYPFTKNHDIRVLDRSKSGRVLSIIIGGVELPGTKFRQLIGYGMIKSTMFELEVKEGSVIFSGSGSGHGVGMCQWGAKGMAEEGRSYRQILEHYYSGTVLKKQY